jgi:hypothetical protein
MVIDCFDIDFAWICFPGVWGVVYFHNALLQKSLRRRPAIGFVFSSRSGHRDIGLPGSDYQSIGLSGLSFLIPFILIPGSSDIRYSSLKCKKAVFDCIFRGDGLTLRASRPG